MVLLYFYTIKSNIRHCNSFFFLYKERRCILFKRHPMKNFSERLQDSVESKNSCLMLGLDPNINKIPEKFSKNAEGCYNFCKEMMENVADLICGVKIQMAYFEIFGSHGIQQVEKLIQDAKKLDLIVLIDGKRNDIGSTCEAYAESYLADGPLGADALTVNAYLGSDGILPFVKKCEENGRGLFILARTSNPSAKEFQDSEDFAVRVAEKIEEWNITTQSEKNMFSSIGAVVGATQPGALKFFREEMPHAWILAPGVGAQGGDPKEALGIRRNKLGLLIPVSRSVLYASREDDYLEAGRASMQELYDMQK